jgi:hypothetical protein
MSIMSYPSEATSQASAHRREPQARGIFAFIMSALHTSRRRQARRILRQYRHLSQTNSNGIPENENGRCQQGGSSKIGSSKVDPAASGAR